MGSDSQTEWRKSWIWLPAAVVAGIVVVVVGSFFSGGSGGRPSNPGGEPSGTATTAPSEASVPPSQEPESEPTRTQVFTPVPLTLDAAVTYERCNGDGRSGYSWADEIGPLDGVVYTSGFTCPMGYLRASGYRDYLVPAGATRFTAVAGQPDDSANTTLVVRFEVLDTTSGSTLASHDLPFGQPMPIDVSVEGLTRITLRQSVVSSSTSPRDLWGLAGWADPTFG